MIVVDNFFTDEELNHVDYDYQQILSSGRFQVNKFLWQPLLFAGYSGSVYMHEVNKDLQCLILNKLRGHVTANDDTGMNHYLWDYKSGINWHHDDHCQWAATIYLAKEWHIHWGGHLMIREPEGDKLIMPAFNRLVINTDRTEHKVTEVRKQSMPLRHTIQIFGR